MSFDRANPFGWWKTDTLTSDQINQIDDNISNAIDKRNGYVNDVYSTVVVRGDWTFESGSSLLIEYADTLAIADGTLTIDGQIHGYSKPVRFGVIECPVTSTSFTVPESVYKKYVIILTGSLTGNTGVYLPELEGYSKIVHNKCTMNGYNLSVRTVSNLGVTLPYNKASLIYCTGDTIVEGITKEANVVKDIYYNAETSAYGTTYQTITSTSPTYLGGSYEKVFYNTAVGDQFEISYTAGLASSNASGTIYMQVTCSDDPFNQKESIVAVEGTDEQVKSVSMLYTTSVGGTIAISLAAHVASYNGYVKTPLSFTVKYIKP